MDRLPAVSIVIPARNAAATIGETLASLAAQSFGDWEALVIDDGSSDATAECVRTFGAGDRRVRLITGEGIGVAAARNRGLGEARGRWLHFLDADDWVAPEFYTKMLAALDREKGAVAAFCAFRRVFADGTMTRPRIVPELAANAFECFARSCAVAIHSVVTDRATAAAAGGFDTTLKTCEDWDFWQRLARTGEPWAMVDEVLAYYRAGSTSLTSDPAQMMADCRTVVARGFRPDPRVPNPAPQHVGGADPEHGDADLACAYFALWCAARDVGEGGSGAVPDMQLTALPSRPAAAQAIASTIRYGLEVGLGAPPDKICARWADYGERLTALIDRLGRIWHDAPAALAVHYALEAELLALDSLAQPRRVGRTFGLRVGLRPPTLELPEGVDRVCAELWHEGASYGRITFGALDDVTPVQWAGLIGGGVRPKHRLRAAARVAPVTLASQFARLAVRTPGKLRALAGTRGLLVQAADQTLTAAAPGPVAPAGSHRAAFIELEIAAKRFAADAAVMPAPGDKGGQTPEHAGEGSRTDFWEQFFAKEDPWNYGSAYEQEKYRHQLEMLPAGRPARALELACAEGLFTAMLAGRVENLLATDISPTAVERARQRCADFPNISFDTLDFASSPIPAGQDLIICSEVFYYLTDRAELARVAALIADALAPGGHFLTAHAFVLSDDPDRTGFDWGHPFGADVIAATFAQTPGLALEASLQTELYRIDRFRRVGADDGALAPTVTRTAIEAQIEPKVARFIVWGGAIARRDTVQASERRQQVPVLMYHRIADDGPEALARYRTPPDQFRKQLRWLRANGYHSISIEEMKWFLRERQPFVGRPVLLTFDDATQDFADTAWPLIEAHDFSAEVFVVTDRMGSTAEWDAELGTPSPLMNEATIGDLAQQGVRFGSHLASHAAANTLSTVGLARELLRSREALRAITGRAPSAFAAPYSVSDPRLPMLAAECGYGAGFMAQEGPVAFQHKRFDLPRVEVRGEWTLGDFSAAMLTMLK